MVKIKSQVSSAKAANNMDSIAGAGGGMLLVKLAQTLSDENVFKSWIIILAPAFTLIIKFFWDFFSPEISFSIKRLRMDRSERKLTARIDVLLNDSTFSEENKMMLREMLNEVKLSSIQVASEYHKATMK